MYVILVYDVNVKRVAEVLQIGRRYLSWVQNSVLEGELTRSQLERLREEIRSVINEEEDSVLFYVLRTKKWLEHWELGRRKGGPEFIV